MTRASLVHHWRTWATALVATGALVVAGMNWADSRWNQSSDIGEIRDNVEFLTRLTVRDRITYLDGRIQMLESAPQRGRDERRTLNELRLDRHQLQRRLEELDG